MEWVQIGMHKCNPEKDLNVDIYPNDKRSALIRIVQEGENNSEIARVYDRDGRFVNSLSMDRLKDLWERFHRAKSRGKHEKVRGMGSFESEVQKLLERYKMKEKNGKATKGSTKKSLDNPRDDNASTTYGVWGRMRKVRLSTKCTPRYPRI